MSTKYYARAYATNSAGTGYGQEVEFTTGILEHIVDPDGIHFVDPDGTHIVGPGT